MTTHEEFVQELIDSRPGFAEEYEKLRATRAFRVALIQARQDAGMTQTELARRIGTYQPVIARLEAGERSPTIETMSKIAKVLNVSFTITPDAGVEVVLAAD